MKSIESRIQNLRFLEQLKLQLEMLDSGMDFQVQPIASKPDDLFSAMNWMWPKAVPSRTKWNDRFMDMTFNAWDQPVVIGVKQHMEKEFFAGLDPFLRRMPKEVILPFFATDY